MPVNFLTEEQRSRYGRFNADPDEGQLSGFFHLDAAARRRAMACRGAGNQLGYGLQLGTARFLGAFLPDPEHGAGKADAAAHEQIGEKARRGTASAQLVGACGLFSSHVFD